MKYKLMYSSPYYYIVNVYGIVIFKTENQKECEIKYEELKKNA